MEEDIIYDFRNIIEESRTEDRTDYYIKLRNTLDLLEYLFKEYKNLQQIEQEHKKENGALREIIKELEQNQCTHNIDNECIRKSKVKEKIEEYKAKGYIEIAGALQQLLEE